MPIDPTKAAIDRYWFLTWTTYGTWLPGDERGFVSPIRGKQDKREIHNRPGTEYSMESPALESWSRSQLKGKPILLTAPHAKHLLDQFHETAAYRGWTNLAIAIISNHVHFVLGVPGDPEPSTLMRDLKSYGSRKLNQNYGKPASETWWTESGSKRKLPNEEAVIATCRYVRDQHNPLLVWINSALEL